MANKKRAVPIDKEKLQQALKDNKITRKRAAKEVGMTEAAFRKAVNTFQELQPDHLIALAELTHKDESYFYRTRYITLKEDQYLPNGTLIAHKGDTIALPWFRGANYTEADIETPNRIFRSFLRVTGAAEAYAHADDEGKANYNTNLQVGLQSLCTEEQYLSVLDSIDKILEDAIEQYSNI